jgi:hypothetical protein
MKTIIGIFFAVAAIAALSTTPAYAWTVKHDNGTTMLIACDDGSQSTIGKSGDGWTVLSAGRNGRSGGQFAIYGQAALAGCGE